MLFLYLTKKTRQSFVSHGNNNYKCYRTLLYRDLPLPIMAAFYCFLLYCF